MEVTSLWSNWLPCTTTSQTHCSGLLTSRAMEKHRRSWGAAHQQLHGPVRHIDRQIEVIKETQLAHQCSGGRLWWYDGGAGDGVVTPGGKVQPPSAGKTGRGRGTRCWYEGRWRVSSRHRQNGFFTSRSAALWRVSLLWRSWCGAAVRVCQTLSAS